MGPVFLMPDELSKLGFQDAAAAESLTFLFFAFLLVSGALFIDFQKNPISKFHGGSFKKPDLFFRLMIIIFFCFHLNCTLAACDGRSNSPAFDFPVPGVPRLDQPLMADAYRSVELQQRLSVHFIGRHDAAHLRPFLAILEKQMLLETRIEAALVADGYDPLSILDRRHQIRGILFNHPTRGMALSERTLNGYLAQIERNGTRQSIPYIRERDST